MLPNSSRKAHSSIKGFLLLALILACCSTAWAYDDYSGCESCHGSFDSGNYQSNHDSANWGTNLMDAHTNWVDGKCGACHQSDLLADVWLNQSNDGTFAKSCVGCHGRDEDVNGSCVGDSGVQAECGSGAGLRESHESKVGAGTCANCHSGDPTPAGEDIQPHYYFLQASTINNSCDANGSESQFGTTGLDNDGDGQRDASDSDCQFGINAGMSDSWYYPATNGQGFFIIVWEDTGLVFLSWFTYDVERPPANVTAIFGEPGHRWVTAQGPFEGDTATLDVYLSSGGVFDSPTPVVPPPVKDGTITIKWNSCTSATLTYDIPSAGQGEIPLQRIVNDNVALCEAL
ncbi:MAG: hypothetical protein EHM68_11235 [Lysobacterales bacterium]|nr:MAG: hypothetical protein EHM68_11235 [Xanthomonadales bacterium]